MTDALIIALDVLIVAVWVLSAWLCWRFDLWSVSDNTQTIDGFVAVNRRIVDLVARQV